MWPTAALWLGVFSITVIETLIATYEGKADRNSTSARTNKWSLRAAHWAAAFELVLFIDILLVVKEGWPILVPILLGAWGGKFWSLERRRSKFRSRVKRPKQASDEDEDDDEA